MELWLLTLLSERHLGLDLKEKHESKKMPLKWEQQFQQREGRSLEGDEQSCWVGAQGEAPVKSQQHDTFKTPWAPRKPGFMVRIADSLWKSTVGQCPLVNQKEDGSRVRTWWLDLKLFWILLYKAHWSLLFASLSFFGHFLTFCFPR